MNTHHSQKIFFLVLFLGIFGLLGYIFTPFFAVILLGIVAGIALEPFYIWLHKKIKLNPSLSAALVVFVVFLCLTLIGTLIGSQLKDQAQAVYQKVINGGDYQMTDASTYINNLIRPLNEEYNVDLKKYVSPVVSFVSQNVADIVSGTTSVVFKFFLWVLTLYFVLKDGRKVKTLITRISPLKDDHDNRLFQRIAEAARSIVRGLFLVALVQGFLVGLGLWFVGIENYILWGLIAALAAPIPLLGTSVIMVPSVIYLVITAQIVPAIILTLWGVMAVGLVDNILTPYVYSKGTSIHPIILLFSILGGLIIFGPVGFIVGPLVATIAITLVSLYQEIVLEEATK